MSYYKDQLSKLSGGTSVNIKMVNNGGETNWLTLNNESATDLVNWLTDNFNIKANHSLPINDITRLSELFLQLNNEGLSSEDDNEEFESLIDELQAILPVSI